MTCMVIGTGESAADICSDVADAAVETTIMCRRVPMLAPRVLDDCSETVGCSKQNLPLNMYLESHTVSRAANSMCLYLYSKLREFVWRNIQYKDTNIKWVLEGVKDYGVRSEQARFATKNKRMAETVEAGKATLVVSKKTTYENKTVTFDDGTSKVIDCIVACTGYQQKFPFLKVDIGDDPRLWYKHCFPPVYAKKHLYMVGFTRPHQGGIPPLAEMQSRYIAMLINGQRTLPEDYAEQARIEEQTEKHFYLENYSLSTLCDYYSMVETMARLIGCTPQIPLPVMLCVYAVVASLGAYFFVAPDIRYLYSAAVLFSMLFVLNDGIIIKFLFYPMWPCWYRLRGPGKKPEIFYNTIGRFPLYRNWSPVHPMVIGHFTLGAIQKVINILLLIPDALSYIFTGKSFYGPGTTGWIWMFDRPKRNILHGFSYKLRDVFGI